MNAYLFSLEWRPKKTYLRSYIILFSNKQWVHSKSADPRQWNTKRTARTSARDRGALWMTLSRAGARRHNGFQVRRSRAPARRTAGRGGGRGRGLQARLWKRNVRPSVPQRRFNIRVRGKRKWKEASPFVLDLSDRKIGARAVAAAAGCCLHRISVIFRRFPNIIHFICPLPLTASAVAR